MRNLIFVATLLAVFVLSGCLFRNNRSSNGQTTADAYASVTNAPEGSRNLSITLEGGLHGTVSSVNHNLKFVVLTFPLGQMPAVNQRLYVYRRGLRVGEINVTGPQRDDSTVADILAGDATIGDEIRDR